MEISYPNPGSSASFSNNRQQQQEQGRYSYPQLAQPVGPPYGRPPPPVPATNPASRTGIRVALKPDYRLAPPPQLLPLMDEIPQSTFQFDFDLERKILEEAQKEGQAGSFRRLPPSLNKASEAAAATVAAEDPVVAKYTMMGLNRDAVVLAIATYGDVQSKVTDFVQSYNVLREVGFEPDKIAGALAMFDNDKERASAYLIG